MDVKQTMYDLAAYALTKKGGELDYGQSLSEETCDFDVKLPHLEYGSFYAAKFVEDEPEPEDNKFARLPVIEERLTTLMNEYADIRRSSWAPRNGMHFIDVPLDGEISLDVIKSFIDESYALIWSKLDPDDVALIEATAGVFDEKALIETLIAKHDLVDQSEVVLKMLRHGYLAVPQSGIESDILIGASKVGGTPDLPDDVPWPMLDKKPLSFLAQINLVDLDPEISGLPKEGLLSIFSAWGWCGDEGYPDMLDEDGAIQEGWTVVCHTSNDKQLSRRSPSESVKVYSAASIDFVLIWTTPNDVKEQVLALQDWSDEILDQYWNMTYSLRSAQMGHWLHQSSDCAPHTLIGGYPLLEHGYPEELPDGNKRLLLQLSSRGTDMDFLGGHLLFYVEQAASREGKFPDVWGTCQPG